MNPMPFPSTGFSSMPGGVAKTNGATSPSSNNVVPPVQTPQTPVTPPPQTQTPAVEPPTITNPTETMQTPPPTQGNGVKILMGIIPLLVFGVTGIISYAIVNNNQQKLAYQSKAAETQAVPTAFPYAKAGGKMLAEASSSGCIFSLRYDATSASATLKDETKTEIDKIKTKLASGEKGEDVLFEVLNGETKELSNTKKQEYITNRNLYLTKYKNFVNPFDKFQVNYSPNFCFKNTKEVNSQLSSVFYSLNPTFQQNFLKQQSSTISDPFQINKSTNSGNIDYGWMLIQKN